MAYNLCMREESLIRFNLIVADTLKVMIEKYIFNSLLQKM